MFNEFKDPKQARVLLDAIRKVTTRPWHIMEICGGQTHALAKYRIEELLPQEITLIHGPGCPVCVTPEPIIDIAIATAHRKDIIFTSFGDMLRVPGSREDLLSIKASGGDVRILYSPLDALQIAKENPDKEVVFFAIGFETTAPVHALTILEAEKRGIRNFSMLLSLFRVAPAIESIASDKESKLNGILAAGHVCAITGTKEYVSLASHLKIPIAVTGFEPNDLLWGIYTCIQMLEKGEFKVENAYKRAVSPGGNIRAMEQIDQVFRETDRDWRGIGNIPGSGYGFRKEYEQFDMLSRFNIKPGKRERKSVCRAGEIMRGKLSPRQCGQFGCKCTPDHPLGAPMVSSEGACAAYYRYNF